MLGLVGAILVVITGFFSNWGGLLGIAGFILILYAVKEISDHVADKSIFNNMLISCGASIVGLVAASILIFGGIASFIISNGIVGTIPSDFTFTPGAFVSLIAPIIGALVIVWVALIISGIFLRRSYSSIADKLGVGRFRTAGLLYLVGAATSIVLIGFFLIFVAEILVALAFYSIPEKTWGQMSPPSPPAPIHT
jgi:uncharacterized membrane protein